MSIMGFNICVFTFSFFVIINNILPINSQFNGLPIMLNNPYSNIANTIPYYDNIISTKFEGPEETFSELLAPIQPPLFPLDLVAIKNKIIELILSHQLEVKPVLDYLLKFQNLDNYDLMVAALIALRDSLPKDCHIRFQIEKLIMHSKFNRCHTNNIKHNSFPRNPISAAPEPGYIPTKLDCKSIIGMIQYFQTLLEQSDCFQCNEKQATEYNNLLNIDQMYKRHSTGVAKQNFLTSQVKLQSDSKLQINKQWEQKFTKINQAVATLPVPKTDEERHNYEIVKSFVHSSNLLNYVQDLKESDYSGQQQLFKVIAQNIVHSSVNVSIQQAFSYYLNYVSRNATTTVTTTEAPTYDYSTLTELIPQPLDAEEREKYKLIKEFLGNKLNYKKYLMNINASYYADTKLLYKSVFKTLSECKCDAKIKSAFNYYLNYEESLAELELFTKKEIKKHFELTKIFVDTLNIDSLSSEAKLSFKKFFKFISNIKKEQLKDFDTWSEVKTKGEFMKALFKYLLEQRFVPLEVHQAILQLQSLVKMDGRGAAPP